MAAPELSLTEWVVLALIREQATHGFAVARELRPDSDLGRILTVHRPLVYRAIARLREYGLVEAASTEPGAAGPNRTVMRATRNGKRRLDRWFTTPVEHVRELRIEFLIKLRLTERAQRDVTTLVDAQRHTLSEHLETLATGGDNDDAVDRWRRHNAEAARNFLDSL